jgi:hypothetical protein
MSQEQPGTVGNTGGGNTKTPPEDMFEEASTGKKYRKWCFTENNPEAGTWEQRVEKFKSLAKFWIIAREVGESGTPHFQGYVEWNSPMLFDNMKKLMPRAWLAKAKGTTEQNRRYCMKQGDYSTNIPLPRRETILCKYEAVEWKCWQRHIIDLVDDQYGDDRTINWFWENDGNVGKSFLTKYLVLKYDAIICSGKSADVFNQVNTWLQDHGEASPKLVVVDIPRCSMDYVNYQAIEAVKNGLLYSGKYEGGVCVFESPVVICMSNGPPDTDKLSMDRWNIHMIG